MRRSLSGASGLDYYYRPATSSNVMAAHRYAFRRCVRAYTPSDASTPIGEVMESFRTAEHQAHALSGAQIQEISIGLNPYASNAMMSDVLQAFRISRPEVGVNVEEEESPKLLRRVADGVLDLAIIHFGDQSVGIPATVAAVVLAEEELVFIERDTGGKPPAKALKFAELASRALVLPKSRQGFRRDLEHVAAQAHVPINVELEINAPAPLLDLVAHGDLGAVVPETTARRAMQHLPLRMYRIVQPSVLRSILCVHRRDRPLSPILTEFVEIVKAKVERGLVQSR